MPATLHHERDNVYRLDIGGVLSKDDLDRVQELLLKEMDRTGVRTVRLLVVLEGFEGWDSRSSNWSDLTFYVKHGDRLERIAIVGDERSAGSRAHVCRRRPPSRTGRIFCHWRHE